MTDEQGVAEEQEEQNGAVLLDQVMRGERGLLFPPGTLAASLVIPCFAVGAEALMMAAGMPVLTSRTAILAPMAAAIILSGVLMTGHVLVIRGRPRHRTWMRIYVHSLIGCTLAGSVVGSVAKVSIPWPLVVGAGIFLALCDVLLGSRAYLAYSSFFSLKRQYREDQARARDRVLGRSRTID